MPRTKSKMKKQTPKSLMKKAMLKTAKKRFARSLQRIADWCRRHLHDPLSDQWKGLTLRLRGHYNYFGVTGNALALWRMRTQVCRTWRRWLCRRSQRGMSWKRMLLMMQRYPLLKPTTLRRLRA